MPSLIPRELPERSILHNEVHARPPARIRLPAFVVLICMLNDGVSAIDEVDYIRKLPIKSLIPQDSDSQSFLSLKLGGANLRWERHSEFSRYTIIQPLPDSMLKAIAAGTALERLPDLWSALMVPKSWLQGIPGITINALTLMIIPLDITHKEARLTEAKSLFAPKAVVGSGLSTKNEAQPHSYAFTDFHLHEDGFEHILLFADPNISETRAGRMAQRLMDIETYRLMALRGFLVAKEIGRPLTLAEEELAIITQQIDDARIDDKDLLHQLVALAAKVEKMMTEHNYRFAATGAYEAIINQRLAELNERIISGNHGILSISTFLQRRLSPAMATVHAAAARLENLSMRINRNSELLSTRVNIATGKNNLELLAKLTRGQQMQLQLQATVEGLSIVAISYYAISLILYTAKAVKDMGVPIKPEVVAGLAIPFVLYGTWRMIRKIHHQLSAK